MVGNGTVDQSILSAKGSQKMFLCAAEQFFLSDFPEQNIGSLLDFGKEIAVYGFRTLFYENSAANIINLGANIFTSLEWTKLLLNFMNILDKMDCASRKFRLFRLFSN